MSALMKYSCGGTVHSIATLIVIGVLVVHAPARAEERPAVITQERNSAVAFALTVDIVATSLAATCASTSEALAAKAAAERSVWRAHNWHLVEAAHKYLLYVKAAVAGQRGEDAGRAFYEEQKARFFAEAKTALAEIFPAGGVTEAECEGVVMKLSDGSMNFEAKPEFFRALEEIETDMSKMVGT